MMSQSLDLVDAADQSDDAVVANVQLNDLVDVILHLSTSLSPIRVPEAADISAEQNINEEDTGQPANRLFMAESGIQVWIFIDLHLKEM